VTSKINNKGLRSTVVKVKTTRVVFTVTTVERRLLLLFILLAGSATSKRNI